MKKILILLCALLMCACTAQTEKPENTADKKEGQVLPPADEVEEDPERKSLYELTEERVPFYTASSQGSKQQDLKEVTITFNRIPETAEDFAEFDRSGSNGKYVVLAELIMALKTWNPDNTKLCEQIMKDLMNSSIDKNAYSNKVKTSIKDALKENELWKYLANAHMDGANYKNGYTPDSPVKIIIRESEQDPLNQDLNGTSVQVDKVIIDFVGGETERSISVYKDPKDKTWYIWDDTYQNLLEEIKAPQ